MLNQPGLAGRHTTANNQVEYHWDGNNSFIYDAVFTLGRNFDGGDLILPYIGYVCRGTHGYSVHAPFKIFLHGVSQIRPLSDLHPPLRISMALYSHSDVYAGVARFAAQILGQGKFSEGLLWLPFFPKGFTVAAFQYLLDQEEKHLHAQYRDVRRVAKGKLPFLKRMRVY